MKEGEIFFNQYSSLSLNLRLTEYPVIPSINEEYDEQKVEGRNGTLYIDKGTYPDRVITFNFTICSNNFDLDFDRIEEWLSEYDDNRLYLKDDRILRIKKIIKGNMQKEFRSIGSFDVTFICDPFFEDVVENIHNFTGTLNINYLGHFDSEPIITITGSGDITISTNGETFKVEDVKSSVIINSKLMNCIENNDNLVNQGEYPLITKGNNTIVVSGNVTNVKIEFPTYYR